MTSLRKTILRGLIAVCQKIGTPLRDPGGKLLCRAFMFSWRGNVHLVGLPNHVQLRPVPMAESRLSYWRQTLSWEQAAPPDFPRIRPGLPAPQTPPVVCHVVICHLPPAETERIFRKWSVIESGGIILIAYGGTEANFRKLPESVDAVYVPDESLRTIDHTRERQEYAGVFRAAAGWLAAKDVAFTHAHIVEFDAVPVISNPGIRLVEALQAEHADVAGFGLVDLTGTIHPHNRHELAEPEFLEFLETLTKRELRRRIFTMLGCSTIWTRECFEEVAALSTPRAYLEIAMPTIAHHLGFRVRPMPGMQDRFITFEGDLTSRMEDFQRQGAWIVHPCKAYWREVTTAASAESTPASAPSKPRLLLFGHTYGAAVNRAKAVALSQWFEVMVCSPDFEGIQVMGRDGSFQEREIPGAPYQYRRLLRWPRQAGFTTCLARRLGEVFEAWRPDIVLSETEPWAVMRWQNRFLSFQQRPRPLFVEFTWENLPRPGIKGLILSLIYRMAARTSDGVVCGNRGSEMLFTLAGMDPARILRTGQLGVAPEEHPVATPEEKSGWRKELGFTENTFVIGFCGRLVEEKGIWDLLAATEALRAAGSNCSLVFLGAGTLEGELLAKLQDRPWARLLPPVPHAEVPGIINRFDLFVLPSKPQLDPAKGIWEEQFGHVLVEAMMCGVPCIGSNSGGIPEVLDDPEVTFPPGDVEALRTLIERFVSDPRRTLELADEQRRTTLVQWTHEALARRYAEFLLKLLASHPIS